MARFVVMVDGTRIDSISYPKGTVVNVPSSNVDVKLLGPLGSPPTTTPLYTVPRLRNTSAIGAGFVALDTLPPYLPVLAGDQLGRQASTGTLPPGSSGPNPADVILEPVLPTENSQYD